MIDKYIAPFSSERSRTNIHHAMDGYPEFVRGCVDFAHAFDLKMVGHPFNSLVVGFFSKSGFHVGDMSYLFDSGQRYFQFHSPRLLNKERSSKRSNRNGRDAVKVTGIIKALKEAGQEPTDERVINKSRGGLTYAFRSLKGKTQENPRMDLSDDETLTLVQHYLGVGHFEDAAIDASVKAKYDEYLKKIDARNAAELDFQRFTSGCTAIKVEYSDYHAPAYIVGEARVDSTTNHALVSDLKRYETLADTEHAGLAAMLRTYSIGKLWHDSNNELGIGCTDLYVDELDVSIGYIHHDRGSWLIIPKKPA